MKVVSTEKAPAAIGPYSQGIVTGGLVFVSGQTPIDPQTGKFAEDITAQAEQSCRNVGEILKAAGSGFEKVVKTTWRRLSRQPASLQIFRISRHSMRSMRSILFRSRHAAV